MQEVVYVNVIPTVEIPKEYFTLISSDISLAPNVPLMKTYLASDLSSSCVTVWGARGPENCNIKIVPKSSCLPAAILYCLSLQCIHSFPRID